MNAMSGLMRRFRRRDTGDPAKQADLFLMIDDSGWRAVQSHATDSGERIDGAVQSGPPAPGTGNAASPIEAAFADAAKNLSNPRSIGRIHVLLDDPSGAYVDLLKSNLAIAGSQALHEYAAELVGRPQVAWGRNGLMGGQGSEARVIAVQGLVDLNGYLTRLDEHATKITRLVPVLDLIRSHLVTGMAEIPLCGLYIARRHSYLMLLNPEQGGVLVRTIRTGGDDFIDALRSGMGIDEAQAAKMFSERDLLTGIAEADEVDGADPASDVERSAVDRAIGPTVRAYIASVLETLDFFEHQRVLGRPARIAMLGSGIAPRGLDGLIADRVGIDVEPEVFDPFSAFRALAIDEGLNLLEATSSDLKIGSVSYRVQQGRIRSVDEIAREDRNQAATVAPEPAARSGLSDRRGRGGSRNAEPIGGLLSRLFSSPPSAGGSRSPSLASDAPAQDRQTGLWVVLFIMLTGAAGYYGYQGIQEREQSLKADYESLSSAYLANVYLKNGRDAATQTNAASGEIDKVLWTEKFLSLAKNMNESMWLTDVYLEVNNRTIGESEIEEKKLVMQGAVLPSTDGHILQIAEFIERLQEDRLGFMDDFREIVFDGAYLDRGESESIVRFTIEARYDAKKRQSVDIQAKSPTGASLGDTTQKIKEHEKAREQAIGGNTR